MLKIVIKPAKCDNNIEGIHIEWKRMENDDTFRFWNSLFFLKSGRKRKSCFGDGRLHEYKTIAEGLINTKLGFCNLKTAAGSSFPPLFISDERISFN